jgi:hypothetical protein
MKTIFLFGGVRLTLILSQPRGMMSKVAMYKPGDLHEAFMEVASCLEDVESWSGGQVVICSLVT